MIQQSSQDVLWSQIVASAWCDEGVMTRLRSDPRTVLAEYDLDVPEDTEVEVVEGAEVKVVAATHRLRQFFLPFSPPDDLADEDLVGGAVAWCGCAACRSAACARCACGACGACGRCGCRCW